MASFAAAGASAVVEGAVAAAVAAVAAARAAGDDLQRAAGRGPVHASALRVGGVHAAVGAGDVPHGEVVGEVGLEVVHGARVEVFDMVLVRHPDERGELCELYALPGDDGESSTAHVRLSS